MPFYNLDKRFFGPDHTLYDPTNNPHEFPETWEIPEGTEEVMMEPKMVPIEAEKKETKK